MQTRPCRSRRDVQAGAPSACARVIGSWRYSRRNALAEAFAETPA
jgi:hypothetical protein